MVFFHENVPYISNWNIFRLILKNYLEKISITDKIENSLKRKSDSFELDPKLFSKV